MWVACVGVSLCLTACDTPKSRDTEGTQRAGLESTWDALLASDAELRRQENLWLERRDALFELLIGRRPEENVGDPVAGALRSEVAQERERMLALRVGRDEIVTGALGAALPEDPTAISTAAMMLFYARLHDSMGPSDTVWPAWRVNASTRSLRPRLDCDDILANGLLILLGRSASEGNAPAYAASLNRIGAALHCGSLDDNRALGRAIVESVDFAVTQLPDSIRESGRRALYNILFNVLMIIHDETKFAGRTAVFNWLRVHRDELKELVSWPDAIIRQHGLWLYGPSTGDFVQLHSFCEQEQETGQSIANCLSLGHLIEASTDPWRLGLGLCGLAEMLAPNPGESGYFCQRGLCEIASSGTSFGIFVMERKETQFGADLAALIEASCNGTRGADGWGEGPRGVGGSPTNDAFGCVSNANSKTPGKTEMSCALDVVAGSYSMDRGTSFGPTCNPATKDGGQPRNIWPELSAQTQQNLVGAKNAAAFFMESDKESWLDVLDDYGYPVSEAEYGRAKDERTSWTSCG
jgi:hypothetical protein